MEPLAPPTPPTPPLPQLGLTTVEDLRQLYRAVIGREPEGDVLQRAKPRPLGVVMLEMAAREEVNRKVLHPLVQQRPLPHRKLPEANLAPLSAWLTERLGLPASEPGEPLTVPSLLSRLYALPELAARMLLAHGSLFTQALEDLALLRRAGPLRLLGKIDFANREFVSGWAMDESGTLPQLQLEVRQAGRVVAVARAFSVRPDILQLHGGSGLVGFRAKWNPAQFPYGQAVTLTLHEASTGLQVGLPYRFDNNFFDQLSVAQRLAKELDEIKQRIDVLAGMVPQALNYAAFPLEHFDLYRRTHRVPPPPWAEAEAQPGAKPLARKLTFTVLIDAANGDPIAARRSIDSLRAQSWSHWQAVVVGSEPAAAEVAALLRAANGRVGHAEDWQAAMLVVNDLAADPDHWVLFLEAGELLDPQALAWVVQAERSSPATTLYWDEDRFDGLTARLPGRLARHTEPILRCKFDPDAMLELNVVGRSFAARADMLEAATLKMAEAGSDKVASAALAHPLAAAQRERLVWSLHALGTLAHIPHFLLSRTGPAAAAGAPLPGGLERLVARASPESLQGLLPAEWSGRRWRRVPDPISPQLPKPLVLWEPERPRALISVLIPTRDHADLVEQCVSSLLALAAQPAALEIIIADNGSTELETLAYLAEGEEQGRFTVMRVAEPFNWSRLNNLMAEAARGEHLLILNNDTRMLTRGWDTALRGLLERPDVGAVGARLLFEDMTIQHAGIRFGYERFVGHEAASRPHDEPSAWQDTQLSRSVSGATGAFLACRATVFKTLGGFDAEQLSVTFNDVEWCMRLRATGLRIVYAPLLSMVHYESKSRGFDFLSPEKQSRAEYERGALLSRLPSDAFDADELRHPALSPWANERPSLQ